MWQYNDAMIRSWIYRIRLMRTEEAKREFGLFFEVYGYAHIIIHKMRQEQAPAVIRLTQILTEKQWMYRSYAPEVLTMYDVCKMVVRQWADVCSPPGLVAA